VCGFLCGYFLPALLGKIELARITGLGAQVRSATDLFMWIVVPATGIVAAVGICRAIAGRKLDGEGAHDLDRS
jgi:hypothetical protein